MGRRSSLMPKQILLDLVEKLNAEGPPELKDRWYYNHPDEVGPQLASSQLPVALVYMGSPAGEIGNSGLHEDAHQMNVRIRVIYDANRDAGKPIEQLGVYNELDQLMWGDDPENLGKMAPNTIAYVLRKYQQFGPNQWAGLNKTLEIGYVSPDEVRRRNVDTLEAEIRFSLTHTQVKPQ